MTTGGRIRAVARGRVQGVGFRWFVHREANRLGVYGWVRNLPDGTVETVAEGPADILDQLVAALREGPAASDVSALDVHREPATGEFEGFVIR